MTVYFEDVGKGYTIPELEKGPVTQVQLVRYAGASGDFNPIHTVPETASEVGLDGTIAHGMLIMAFAGQLLTDWAGVGSLRNFKVRFSGMTFPGEIVVCEGRVTKTSEEAGEHLVHGKLTIKGKEKGDMKLKGDFSVALPTRE